MLKIFPVFSLFLCLSFSSFSQQTAVFTNDMLEFNQAVSLYNNGQYLAAQNLFAKVKATAESETVESDCAYYIANCAVRLNQQDADQLMETFVEEHPTSLKRNSAFIDVANYYFGNGKYSHAQKWYEKVDETNLSRSERERFNFNNGYAYFKAGQNEEAKNISTKFPLRRNMARRPNIIWDLLPTKAMITKKQTSFLKK